MDNAKRSDSYVGRLTCRYGGTPGVIYELKITDVHGWALIKHRSYRLVRRYSCESEILCCWLIRCLRSCSSCVPASAIVHLYGGYKHPNVQGNYEHENYNE